MPQIRDVWLHVIQWSHPHSYLRSFCIHSGVCPGHADTSGWPLLVHMVWQWIPIYVYRPYTGPRVKAVLGHIERGSRFISDEQIGLSGQGHVDHHPLVLTTRKLVQPSVETFLDIGEADQPKKLHSPLACSRMAHAPMQDERFAIRTYWCCVHQKLPIRTTKVYLWKDFLIGQHLHH